MSDGIRPVDKNFIALMEEKLQQGREYGYVGWDNKWKNCVFPTNNTSGATGDFMRRLSGEVLELSEAITKGNIKEIGKECADVANFAMFIADMHGALKDCKHGCNSKDVCSGKCDVTRPSSLRAKVLKLRGSRPESGYKYKYNEAIDDVLSLIDRG